MQRIFSKICFLIRYQMLPPIMLWFQKVNGLNLTKNWKYTEIFLLPFPTIFVSLSYMLCIYYSKFFSISLDRISRNFSWDDCWMSLKFSDESYHHTSGMVLLWSLVPSISLSVNFKYTHMLTLQILKASICQVISENNGSSIATC